MAWRQQLSTAPYIDVVIMDLRRALDRLAIEAPHMAEVLDLYYFWGLTHYEISERLGIPARHAAFYRCKAIQIFQLKFRNYDPRQSHHH